MIQATELRLNNYVKYNGIIMTVTGVDSPKPRKEKRFDGKYIVELFDGTGFIIATTAQIEGIPLTEDILLKCGFDENYYHFSIGDFILRKPDFVVCDMGIRVQPKYLHQLQNLYFALTGKELTTNL